MKKQTLDAFEKQFGYIDGVEVYFAPGRVNLIGEHTDYVDESDNHYAIVECA